MTGRIGPAMRQPPRHRPVLAVAAFAAIVGVIIGMVVVGPLGGSSGDERWSAQPAVQAPPAAAAPTAPVTIEMRTKKLVWVCLIDQGKRPVINGLNLLADQEVGPYGARAFDVAFGNGSIDL